MNRIPFSLPDVGLREIRGVVYLDDGFLVLQIKNAFLGLVDEQSDVVKVAPEAVIDLHVKTGFVRDHLVIEPKSVELLEAVPGEHLASVKLRTKRKYRRHLERLVDEFEMLLY